MLHLVPQLRQHPVGNIFRALGAEINAHALGTDQLHHLFDLVQQRFGCAVEQQVGFVKEEYHLGFRQVAYFRQRLK